MAGVVGLREVRYGYDGANHLKAEKDNSNPYFTFDPTKCIVCSRCVRACEEVQGTFALTIDGRGFASVIAAGNTDFHGVRMRVLRRLRAGLPDRHADGEIGDRQRPARSQRRHHLRLLRRGLLLPRRDEGHRSRAHGAEQGRQGQSRPFLREGPLRLGLRHAPGPHPHADDPQARSRDPWREVSWDEAIAYAASEFKRIQAKYGRDSVGGITSSRCTNEETYLVQKLVRAAFGNNNVDTCARVCHSPTGYGLKTTLGESAGTQDFDSVSKADVIMVIGANPTDGHPVFASQMKRRLREGAKLIVVDPRRIDLVRQPHVEADYHLQAAARHQRGRDQRAGARGRHRGLARRKTSFAARCDLKEFEKWKAFIAQPHNSPEAMEAVTGVPAAELRGAARLYASGRQRRDLLRTGRHRAQPGLDHGDRHRQPGDGHRQHRPRRRGRESAARPEQRAGLLRHGLVPARAAGLPPRVRSGSARAVRNGLGREARVRAGPAHPQHVRRLARRHVQGPVRPGRGHRPVRPRHAARDRGAGSDWNAWWCRTCSSTRRRSSRTCSCPAPRSWRRTAPSPTPSAASRACAR